MAFDDTRKELLELEQAHHDVHDGGYKLASALCEYRARMPDNRAAEWDDVLLTWVRDESEPLWGVALEALAQAGEAAVDEELSALLREPRRSEQWGDYVANTLIRRGFSSPDLMSRVEQAAERMRPMGLPNLAALLVIAPEMIGSAIRCIVAANSEGKQNYVDGHVPPFVHAAAKSDPELLVRLVQRTFAQDDEAGRRLGTTVADYLDKPFVQRRFREGVATEMASRVRGTIK